jgi:flagellar assembly protein FliH
LRSFEEDGRAIVAQARAKAREILSAAIVEAAKLREEAARAGFEAGRAEGCAQAREAERARIAGETAGLAKLLEGVAQGIEAKRAELLAEAERDLVSLSIAIAERILRGEVAAGRPVAQANLRRAIELVVNRNELEILVHPEDLGQVEAFVPELRKRFTEIARIELRADPSVSRGGCAVLTKQGGVDADLQTQLGEIERALLG